ncbi:hypothetical protein [Stenotrophomonas rhizophila]|uniref:hypothetical protein n=1 Tax=Stenotrophomonas rhizophila TaxID=216778 RepID=UPI00112F2A03|nr:hypothetical protein [Stenotrophomonas rhizophila]
MTSGIYNTDPMESPRYQLEKARKKFFSVKPLLKEHSDSEPFRVVIEECASTENTRILLRRIKNPPMAISDTVNDAFEALRKALDQVGYAIAHKLGKRGKKCAFPFGDSDKEVRARASGPSAEIPPEIFSIMAQFKPHKEGDKLLWALNEIANTSKHRITKVFPNSISQTSIGMARGSGSFSLLGPWDEQKGEMVIAEVGPESTFELDGLKFNITLVFGDIPYIESTAIEPVFMYLESKVKQILDAVEAKAVEMRIF